MAELKQYLDCTLNDDEKKEYDIDGSDLFVVDSQWQHDPNYEELSVGYFKFESKAHRKLAKQRLIQRRKDEAVIFSHCILQQESWTENEVLANLAWNVRPVPQCCCSPHIPHLVQDKMILIQN